ncbi:MAG: GAF domain-containing sensor histidine kinase [Actinomycetota bacterium]
MSDERALEALSDAVLAVGGEQSVAPILQKLVHAARELVGARYAALGVPDDEGGFAEFLVSGLTDDEIEAIGPLPRSHGMLDAVMESTESMRLPDLQQDDRFGSWWPQEHPDMHSFLGVPIVAKGTVIGALYLSDKENAGEFAAADQSLIERFAAHAAVVMENARLFEESRELTVAEERNRLARELHDSVSQTLFSLSLTAEAAAELLDEDPVRARKEIQHLAELARSAQTEMRNLVFELRPADLVSDGLVATLGKHVEVLRRVYGISVDLDVAGDRRLDATIELALFRILQEALNNALKHSGATAIRVSLDLGGGIVRGVVTDDGGGFDPHGLPVRSKHLGLASMEERARDIGSRLRIESARGRGTAVSVEVPV